MTRRLIASVILASFLAACANNGSGGYDNGTGISKSTIGGLAGAGLGGLAGSAFGKGNGRLWTTGAGVLLGALAGSSIGNSLDKVDQQYASRAQTQAFAAPVGQQITWNNPDSGNSGTYVATRSGHTNDGRVCREFHQTIIVGGKSEEGVGQACQQSDGSWAIQPSGN
jgi:surface antigen